MSGFYDWLGPLLRIFDPETAHKITVKALKWGLVPTQKPVKHPSLETELWGITFPNPLGISAGFDKDGEVPDALLSQGFGFVEVGSITPRPQYGNPKPRLFRLREDRAVINRMGFNSFGADAAAARFSKRKFQKGIVGINLGKNKETEDATADYVIGAQKLAPYASYIVINVSSPNTPGLRALQGREPLEALLNSVREALVQTCGDKQPPLLLKIAPDLTEEDKADIASIIDSTGVDGLIATNTTITRPNGLKDMRADEAGGLSGRPLKDTSTEIIRDMYHLTGGSVPIIGVGGIDDAESAYAKIRAGASLVQLYTALVYKGMGLVPEILAGLLHCLERDGFHSICDAVGAAHQKN